tara:strand:- start:498 stop:650 length:153 start_codon:yes stop_codon:yes gene_type:complete
VAEESKNLNWGHDPEDNEGFTIADMTDQEVDQFADKIMQLMANKKSKAPN